MSLLRTAAFQSIMLAKTNIIAEDKFLFPSSTSPNCFHCRRSWTSVRTSLFTNKIGFRMDDLLRLREKRGCAFAFRRRYPRRQQINPKDYESDPALDIQGLQSPQVRLINEQQHMVGIVDKNKAIELSEEAGLDLVIVSADAKPPVVKIMDYSKFRFAQQKKKKEQQRKSRIDLKELKMGYNIAAHDYEVRLKAAKKFLKEGDKVKVIALLKGRQRDHYKDAIDLLERFSFDLKGVFPYPFSV
eukprot:TRINITY_DN824_c0_g1_i1.p1 TRINITY_DN824_c0_g1~~TRINITY_DN824_c0_g1_i1.p1  ORF type:complete len:243 (-),score=38.93 TRINITY_DN824_c0_g1_i1:66-794(-)